MACNASLRKCPFPINPATSADKKIFLIYNASNFHDAQLPKIIKRLPLSSHVNALKITRYGADTTYDEILKSQNIDCLYTIGVAPTLRKKYGTVIVQDCFLPDFDFDVFLPAAMFTETTGSLIDIDGKIVVGFDRDRIQRLVEEGD